VGGWRGPGGGEAIHDPQVQGVGPGWTCRGGATTSSCFRTPSAVETFARRSETDQLAERSRSAALLGTLLHWAQRRGGGIHVSSSSWAEPQMNSANGHVVMQSDMFKVSKLSVLSKRTP